MDSLISTYQSFPQDDILAQQDSSNQSSKCVYKEAIIISLACNQNHRHNKENNKDKIRKKKDRQTNRKKGRKKEKRIRSTCDDDLGR